jgi:hypothetical protein
MKHIVIDMINTIIKSLLYIYSICNDHSGDNDRYHENSIMIIMNLMISTVIITTIIITTRMLRMIVIDNQETHNINR